MSGVAKKGGIFVGNSHDNGGIPIIVKETQQPIEVEGQEPLIPAEAMQSEKKEEYTGTNKQILDEINKSVGAKGMNEKAVEVHAGDAVICKRSAHDKTKRKYVGTPKQVVSAINESGGCKNIESGAVEVKTNGVKVQYNAGGGIKEASPEELQARWTKKRESIETLSNNIQKLRYNVSTDLKSDNEKVILTAIVVAIMDRTAERVGNSVSAKAGHFGITGLKKNHIAIIGNKIHLEYKGKSGVEHTKSFSDERISKLLKKAIKNSPSKKVFVTSDGFQIKADRINRYLSDFDITAKDIRGYSANKWMIEKLSKQDIPKEEKDRKKLYLKTLRQVAEKVGHGSATLRKHYVIPQLETKYVSDSEVIDISDRATYEDGGEMGKEKKTIIINSKKIKDEINYIDSSNIEGTSNSSKGIESNGTRDLGVSAMRGFKQSLRGKIINELQHAIQKREGIKTDYENLYKDHHEVWDKLDVIEKEICETTCDRISKEIVTMWDAELKAHFKEEESVLFPSLFDEESMGVIDELMSEHKEIISLIDKIEKGNKTSDILEFCKLMKSHIKKEEKLMSKVSPDPFKEGGEILLAPNGEISNLTPKQYKLVRTKEFKEWFGDWENDPKTSSKVVDENGEPLVVYHGAINSFNVFDRGKIGYLYHKQSKITKTGGFYFTDNYAVAKSYINRDEQTLIEKSKRIISGNIKHCFLNIRNMYIAEASYKWQCVFNRGDECYSTDDISRSVYTLMDNDGVCFKNVIDAGNSSVTSTPSNIFVAFESNQIKLADGKNTTFDNSNPDVRFKEGDIVSDFENTEEKSNFIPNLTKKDIQYVISGKSKVRNGSVIQAASNYLRTSKGSSSEIKGSKFFKKQEEKHLRYYITHNSLWVNESDFKGYISEGAEQKVYLIDSKNVVKINDSIFYNSWSDYLHSLILHNYFFPDTAYELIGFIERDGNLYSVVRQTFVEETEKTDLTRVKNFMIENGFVNTKNNDYYNPELGIILEDLHDENVLTKDGVLYFVDTVFYISSVDNAKIGSGDIIGKGEYKVPENHKPFMQVPKGGSSCANCKWLTSDKKNCSNKYFIEWYGKSELPQPIDEYCSDWYEPVNKLYNGGGVDDDSNVEQNHWYHGTCIDFKNLSTKNTGAMRPDFLSALGLHFTNDISIAIEEFSGESSKFIANQNNEKECGKKHKKEGEYYKCIAKKDEEINCRTYVVKIKADRVLKITESELFMDILSYGFNKGMIDITEDEFLTLINTPYWAGHGNENSLYAKIEEMGKGKKLGSKKKLNINEVAEAYREEELSEYDAVLYQNEIERPQEKRYDLIVWDTKKIQVVDIIKEEEYQYVDLAEFKTGGVIKFEPKHLPDVRIFKYAEYIRSHYPKVWYKGGNNFGNKAFYMLRRVLIRGYWLEDEKWFYIKWQSYLRRHHKDYKIAGVVAMLKWIGTTDEGVDYMKNEVDEAVEEVYGVKMSSGGYVEEGSDNGVLVFTNKGNDFGFNVDPYLGINELKNVVINKSQPEQYKWFIYKGIKHYNKDGN